MGQNEVNSIIASLLLSGQGFGVWAIYKHFAHGRVSASWGAEANAPVPAFWDEKITMLVQPEGAALKQGGQGKMLQTYSKVWKFGIKKPKWATHRSM